MLTVSVLDERRGTVQAVSRRVVLSGQTRWWRGALLVGAASLGLGAVAALVGLACRILLHRALPWVCLSATAGALGVLCLVATVALQVWPPSCWRMGGDKDTRRHGLAVARSWPSLARAAFPPVADLRGHTHLPGLRRVTADGAALVLSVGLPPVVVPGGTVAYLEGGAGELAQRLGLAQAEALPIEPGAPAYRLRLVPRDVTAQAREVLA